MEATVPDWLSALRKDMESITANAARAHWPGPPTDSAPYYNYRLEHVTQVERDAIRLLQRIGGDKDIVLASVWIHDRFQPLLGGLDHAVLAAQWAQEHVARRGFPEDKVQQVSFAVANHSSEPHTIPRGAKEARLLWDADRLSKIGAVSVVVFLCLNPAFPNRPVTHAGIAETGLAGLEEARAVIDMFYREASRTLAQERLSAYERFYQALAREVMH